MIQEQHREKYARRPKPDPQTINAHQHLMDQFNDFMGKLKVMLYHPDLIDSYPPPTKDDIDGMHREVLRALGDQSAPLIRRGQILR